MEGKKPLKVPGTAAPKMIPAEEATAQLQKLAATANEKIKELALQLQTAETLLRDKTLDYLYKVLDNAHHFEGAFVERCAGTLQEYITKQILDTPKEQPTEGDANKEEVKEAATAREKKAE